MFGDMIFQQVPLMRSTEHDITHHCNVGTQLSPGRCFTSSACLLPAPIPTQTLLGPSGASNGVVEWQWNGSGMGHVNGVVSVLISLIADPACCLLPSQRRRFWAFGGMMFQVPLMQLSEILRKKLNRDDWGNFIFWITFCVVGQVRMAAVRVCVVSVWWGRCTHGVFSKCLHGACLAAHCLAW